jgi:very-short-patch-repair endonuclease
VYRLPGSPLPHQGKLLAACRAGGPDARASHRSAAWLWDLPGGSVDLVEITCVRWRRAQQSGLVVHETKPSRPIDRTALDGMPVTTVARTLLDLGAVLTPSVVEMAVERALRREQVTLAELEAIVRALGRRGRNGAGVLRQLLAARIPRSSPTESDMETRLRRVLVRHGLPAPTPQYVIRDGARFVARVDFAYPDQRIAIEYDSLDHHTGRRAHIRDNARRNEIVSLDWALIVATVEDVRSGGDALARAIYSRFGVRNVRRSA